LQRHLAPYVNTSIVRLALRIGSAIKGQRPLHEAFRVLKNTPYDLSLWLHLALPRLRYAYLRQLNKATCE
jgi:hypothetical protein